MPSLADLLTPWGELRPQPAFDWQGPAGALPVAVAKFYRDVGPWGAVIYESVGPVGLTINTGGNPVCVPPLHKLWAQQDGYAWSRNPDNLLPGWRENWLVVATKGADPLLFDRDDGRILIASAGVGKAGWQPRAFAEDLESAFGGIATVANALTALGDDAFDEDFNLRPESRERVRTRLAQFLGSPDVMSRMLEAWRWYE
ncbi:MAG TPA: hypothetical protein VIM98_06630 [Dyella sp.]|uniref:hypothetical protein n=1 Tax=Dyella sp. TaxID=1869338 RepID=UPI002F93FCA3